MNWLSRDHPLNLLSGQSGQVSAGSAAPRNDTSDRQIFLRSSYLMLRASASGVLAFGIIPPVDSVISYTS